MRELEQSQANEQLDGDKGTMEIEVCVVNDDNVLLDEKFFFILKKQLDEKKMY